jgi:hypothetical protein
VPAPWHEATAAQHLEDDMMRSMALALMLAVAPALAPASAEEPPEIFTVITSASAETQFMALILTTQAVEQGAQARVLLCDEGGRLGLRATETPPFGPRQLSPTQLLQGLIERGSTVEVCAIFLPGREEDEGDLIEGVGVAAPPDVAGHMIRPNVRYFTF